MRSTRQILEAIGVLAFGHAAVLVCGLATVKILAVLAGPAAVGAFGLMRSAQQLGTIVGSLGGDNWVVQGVAARSGQESQGAYMTAAWWMLVTTAAIASATGAVLAFGGMSLAGGALGEVYTPFTVLLLGFCIAAGILLVFYRSQLLARLRTGKVARVNALASATGLVLAYPVAHLMAKGSLEWGAALLLMSLATGLASAVIFCRRLGITAHSGFGFPRPTRTAVSQALSIAWPTLAIFAIGTTAIFALRSLVIQRLGVAAGGLYDAAWTLSTVALGLMLTSVSNYVLPASAMSSAGEAPSLFDDALRVTILLAVPMIVLVVAAKGWLVLGLYTAEFLPSTEVLRWMLLGDYLKATAWIFATYGYARGRILAYGIIEFVWAITVITTSLVLVSYTGKLESFGIGYLAGYLVYAAFWAAYSWRSKLTRLSRHTTLLWLAGAAIVGGASTWCWDTARVSMVEIAVLMVVTAAFCALHLNSGERAAVRHFAGRLLVRARGN